MSSAQIVFGVDPGLASLGWGIVVKDKGDLKVVKYGCITTKSSTELPARLITIYDEIMHLFDTYKPDVLAIEKLFFGKNAKTAMVVGESRGVIMLSAAKRNLTIYEYSPAEIKIALTGYGNADKNQVQRMVQQTLKLEKIPRPNHAADALAVAITASVSNNIILRP